MVPIACMPSLIPRQVGWNLFARTIPFASAFPELWAGRLLHHYFRGLLSVHSRYSLHARRVALATLCTRGFSGFVASTAALIATGWSETVPGRVYPRCGPAPSRRTRVARYTSKIGPVSTMSVIACSQQLTALCDTCKTCTFIPRICQFIGAELARLPETG